MERKDAVKAAYYTIDDLRLGHDPNGVSGWRLSRFLALRDALERYRGLSPEGVKSLGLTGGGQMLELVRCMPLLPLDTAGEDVLVTDFQNCPRWNSEPEVLQAAEEAVSALGIRHCLDGDRLVPAPGPLPAALADKYLWGSRPGDPSSAVRWVYAGGVGWLSPAELKRRYPPEHGSFRRPLVLKYRADGVTASGCFTPLEVGHWEYKWLERRARERLTQNHRRSD